MLKKLRRKFVLINMTMISIVVIAVLVTIGVVSYQQSVNAVYSAITTSVQRESRAAVAIEGEWDSPDTPMPPADGERPPKPGGGHGGPGGGPEGQFFSPQIGGKNNDVTPVAVYSMTESGELQIVSHASSAALSEDVLAQAMEELRDTTKHRGALPEIGVYYVEEFVNGAVYYGFADASSAIDPGVLAITLVLIGAGTLLVFWLLSTVFSRWALRPVEEAWTSQKQFIADASHDLKTPLTVILANNDIMMSHPEKSIESQYQWLESTQREALDMQDMVASMLDLARLDADEATGGIGGTSSMESVNLSDVALGEMLQFESIAFEKSILFEDDIEEDLSVMGDPQQIGRLCGTLLDNACKYAPANSTISVNLKAQGGITLKNSATTAVQGTVPKGRVAVLTVANQGEPIAADDLPHVFDRFYRSDKTRTHGSTGANSYGLGLAIAAGTATTHKGCIAVTSAEGAGTTFTVVLPLSNK